MTTGFLRVENPKFDFVCCLSEVEETKTSTQQNSTQQNPAQSNTEVSDGDEEETADADESE